MPREARAVARALARARINCPIVTIGIGAQFVPASLDAAVDLIILAGLAGGLDPSLAVGDVVIQAPPNQSNPADWIPANARLGKIAGALALVCTPQEKLALGRSSGCVAVDMETHIVAAYAERVGKPLLIIRAISDTAAHGIDPKLINLFDANGRIRPLSVAQHLLRSPSSVVTLFRLHRAASFAEGRLGDALVHVLRRLDAGL
jgi:hypothetical protein